jgi:hypothetical protein
MAGVYTSLDWNAGPHQLTASGGARRDAGRARLDRVEGRDSLRTGPSRIQDVPLKRIVR